MSIRIAINGYGRIGRQVLRAIYENNLRNEFEVVAVNASGDLATNAHLTQFDTVHGRFNAQVSHDEKSLVINGDVIPFFSTRNPAELPWGELKVDLVLECTGAFTSKEKCQAHITAGAKKVLISAPGGDDVDATIVYGVNHNVLTADMTVVSNASCTTNHRGLGSRQLAHTDVERARGRNPGHGAREGGVAGADAHAVPGTVAGEFGDDVAQFRGERFDLAVGRNLGLDAFGFVLKFLQRGFFRRHRLLDDFGDI